MTREEAKEILTHNWTRVDNPNYSESELDEAFFMAIEALSREQKYDAICDELLELKSDLMLPIEVAMAVVMKYAKRGGSK